MTLGSNLGGAGEPPLLQGTTEALAHICFTDLRTHVFPYIDDMGTLHLDYSSANKGHSHLLDTMEDVGLESAPDKCVPATQHMTFVGIDFNSVDMIMSVDPERVVEALDMCGRAFTSRAISEKDLQSLIGKLYHDSICAPGAERFINRLRQLMPMASRDGMALISGDARLDIVWFLQFLPAFN